MALGLTLSGQIHVTLKNLCKNLQGVAEVIAMRGVYPL